jgi:hypothetical protein
MHNEAMPRGKEELVAERDRLLTLIEAKKAQTEANVSAGVIEAGAPDEDAEALAAELEAVESELTAIHVAEQDERITDSNHGTLDI